MKPTTSLAIRRNTAIATENLVENTAIGMLRDEVTEGATLWGFDITNPETEPLVFLADNPGTREWTQHVAEPFGLVAWVVKKVMLTDPETGEGSVALRIVLIDGEHETLAFVSVGVAASLDLIRTLRGDGPYDPPIPVVILPVKTRRGFQTLKLKPVTNHAVVKTTKK